MKWQGRWFFRYKIVSKVMTSQLLEMRHECCMQPLIKATVLGLVKHFTPHRHQGKIQGDVFYLEDHVHSLSQHMFLHNRSLV